MVGLNVLEGLFQPKSLYDSSTTGEPSNRQLVRFFWLGSVVFIFLCVVSSVLVLSQTSFKLLLSENVSVTLGLSLLLWRPGVSLCWGEVRLWLVQPTGTPWPSACQVYIFFKRFRKMFSLLPQASSICRHSNLGWFFFFPSSKYLFFCIFLRQLLTIVSVLTGINHVM